MGMIKKHDLINMVIEKMRYKSYLEIGICTGKNFSWIRIPEKDGVDPDASTPANHIMTSDQFFKENKKKYDVIFIDGDHKDEQVAKDINNAKKALNPKGLIFIHDIDPKSEYNSVESQQGTGWKVIARHRMKEKDWWIGTLETYDVSTGAMCKGQNNLIPVVLPNKMDYGYFKKNRRQILNIVSTDELLKQLKTL